MGVSGCPTATWNRHLLCFQVVTVQQPKLLYSTLAGVACQPFSRCRRQRPLFCKGFAPRQNAPVADVVPAKRRAGPDSLILERRIHSPHAIGLEFRKEFLTLPHLLFSKRQRL